MVKTEKRYGRTTAKKNQTLKKIIDVKKKKKRRGTANIKFGKKVFFGEFVADSFIPKKVSFQREVKKLGTYESFDQEGKIMMKTQNNMRWNRKFIKTIPLNNQVKLGRVNCKLDDGEDGEKWFLYLFEVIGNSKHQVERLREIVLCDKPVGRDEKEVIEKCMSKKKGEAFRYEAGFDTRTSKHFHIVFNTNQSWNVFWSDGLENEYFLV